MIELASEERGKKIATIKVIGVGGAGGNTINSIIASGWQDDINFIAINTDAQALEQSHAHHVIQIGVKSTKGLGSGTDPELGKRSAEEDMDKILETVSDADIVFLTAGMGGGTGSGALPVIARALKEHGILSIAIVTKPFLFEGKRRARVAEMALDVLKKEVDTLIVIPNQKLLDVVDATASMIDAFARINEILSQSIKGISDIITKPGHINVDFADVRTIMKDRGLAVMGTGRSTGVNRAREATLQAIESPLLENMSIEGARGVLLNITGSRNLGLHEISAAASLIYERADEDANIILGSVIDETMDDEVSVTIIATGFIQKPAPTMSIEQVSAALLAQQLVQETKVKEVSVVQVAHQVEVAIAPAVEAAPEVLIVKEVEIVVAAVAQEPVDISDLDVPAFMRREASQKDSLDQ
jgi:cell division protein FtsZ